MVGLHNVLEKEGPMGVQVLVYSSGDEALKKVHIGCSHVRRDDATSSMVCVTMAWSEDHGVACEAMRTRGKTSWRIPP